MTAHTEKFATSNKASVDSLLAVANTALASAERIAALNLETVRSTMEDSASGVKAMLSAKDPKEALAVQTSLAQPAVEKTIAYARSLYEISTETQQEFARLIQAQFGDFQKTMTGLIQQATKSAPTGSEGAVAAMQQAFSTATSAFGNMNTMAKQVVESAQANVASATEAVTATAKKAK